MLGSTIAEAWSGICCRTVVQHSRSDVDLANVSDLKEYIQLVVPDVIFNFAALADVEKCEVPQAAYLQNVKIVENIVASIKSVENKPYFINISTDQVYDGTRLHKEDDVTLTNYYAFSKYAGELAASAVASCSLRTNFFGKSLCDTRRSFSDWLYDALSHDVQLTVFDDVFFNPLSMKTLASVLGKVERISPEGIFNVGSSSVMSKADFACCFAEELGFPRKLLIRASIDTSEYVTTYRPKNMAMDVSKLENLLGMAMPTLKDEIIQTAKDYVDE